MNAITELEARQMRTVPSFKAGDTVRVHFQVIEGSRRRVQVFEGIVIKRHGAGARETFTVRKQSFGVGVERTFPVHSPKIDKIEVAGDRRRQPRRSSTTCAARSASRRACARSSAGLQAAARTRRCRTVLRRPGRCDRAGRRGGAAIAWIVAVARPRRCGILGVGQGVLDVVGTVLVAWAGRVRGAGVRHQAVPGPVAVDGADAAGRRSGDRGRALLVYRFAEPRAATSSSSTRTGRATWRPSRHARLGAVT